MDTYKCTVDLTYTNGIASDVAKDITITPDLQQWVGRALSDVNPEVHDQPRSQRTNFSRFDGEAHTTEIHATVQFSLSDVPSTTDMDRSAESVEAALRNPSGATLTIEEWVRDTLGADWSASLSVTAAE